MGLIYEKPNMSLWQGRIDSDDDYDSFRWHQYIKPLDFNLALNKSNEGISIVFIGYKVDEGINRNLGFKGASYAPDTVRAKLANRPCTFSQDVKLYDGGNILYDNSVEQSQKNLSDLVALCLKNNYFPIVIGGGHDVSYGTMSGIVNSLDLANNELGLINFDAHFDNRPFKESTSGTMFRQIQYDMYQKDLDFNHLTIGIQKSANTIALFRHAEQAGSKYILARDITADKIEVNQYIINDFMKNLDYLYVTVCTDVFASAFAPGVSAPQPMGILPVRFMELFRPIILSGKTVAFDIAEISPPFDNANTTSALGATIIYSIVDSLARLNGYDLYSELT